MTSMGDREEILQVYSLVFSSSFFPNRRNRTHQTTESSSRFRFCNRSVILVTFQEFRILGDWDLQFQSELTPSSRLRGGVSTRTLSRVKVTLCINRREGLILHRCRVRGEAIWVGGGGETERFFTTFGVYGRKNPYVVRSRYEPKGETRNSFPEKKIRFCRDLRSLDFRLDEFSRSCRPPYLPLSPVGRRSSYRLKVSWRHDVDPEGGPPPLPEWVHDPTDD